MMHLGRTVGSLAAAGSLAASLLAMSATPALATIDQGSCTATATATKSGTADLTTQAEWTVVEADQISGSWQGPTQTHLTIGADIFGRNIPVLSRNGNDDHGSAGPYNVADYSKFARVIPLWGYSDDCSGYLTLTISDANPITNYTSLVALAFIILGLLLLLLLTLSRPNLFKRILGILLGFLVGTGIGIVLIEIGFLDPQSPLGLFAPGVGFIIGAILPGIFYHAPTASNSMPSA
jgi:hypothetical protein